MRPTITTTFTPRVKPTDAVYNRPRYVTWTALCDIIQDLLHDITWDQLVTADPTAVPVKIIDTIYT